MPKEFFFSLAAKEKEAKEKPPKNLAFGFPRLSNCLRRSQPWTG